MQYLTVLKFPLSLQSMLLSEHGIKVSKTGLHTILWGFNALKADEKHLIKSLSGIYSEKFKLTITEEGTLFDGNLRVLLLEKSKPLYNLHRRIVATSRPFDKTPKIFDKNLAEYGEDNYVPHIALPGIEKRQELKGNYAGTEMGMVKFNLMRRKDNNWIDVEDFWFKG